MQDRIGFCSILIQRFNGLDRWKHLQFNVAPFRLALHLFHHRQSAVGPCAGRQPAAFPRDVLFYRERRMSKSVAEFLGGFFLFVHLPTIDHHVVFVSDSVNLD